MHLSMSSPRREVGGEVGPPGKIKNYQKQNNGLLLFYYLKLKDQMHDVRSKSPPWDIRHSQNPMGCPTPPPPRA